MSRSSASSMPSGGGGGGANPSHIWAARNVEWPIPSVLSTANYQKLWRASRQTGAQLGIASADAPQDSESGEASGGPNLSTPRMAAGPATSESGESTSYFTGFMNRVLNNAGSAQGDNKSDPSKANAGGALDANNGGGSRPLRPPRPHCVATANGWIVAALECPSPTAGILRLISRWNVRRGSSADQWMALPPPCGGTTGGRVQHVFVDPTGCHTIVSAQNGEAYYLHSSLRLPQKLAGFGPNPDGNLPATLSGIPATSSNHTGMGGSSSTTAIKDNNTQQGLSAGSHVTAVAWDVERGTEGSTKKILLGTNLGEIYEYALISPTSEDQEEAMASPLLLHRLVRDSGEEGPTAVTGLHLERLRTGLLILASTSGRNSPRTRLYTFYSPHNTSFRMALADQQHATLVDIPGAVDFAELRMCNDHFGLRTAMGIYYGTIDRSQSSNVLVTGGRSMIVDAGILPYEDVLQESSSSAASVSSLALTPHHMILLNDSNDHHHHHGNRPPEVRFINRVAQKVIQRERMDLLTHHHHGGNQSNNPFATSSNSVDDSAFWLGAGELLMDIRRPDQVWLRQGRSLIHISSTQEDRDVWKYSLSKCLEKPKGRGVPASNSSLGTSPSLSRSISGAGPILSEEEKAQEALFEQAKNLCTNAAQKAVVTNIRAEYHLSQGRAELAAKYLAQCPPALAPFADTSIRLALPRLGIDDPQGYGHEAAAKASLAASNIPLITYLSDKLRVSQMNQDKMASTMLGAWLTELYLHERGEQQQSQRGMSGGNGARKDDAMLSQFLGNLQNTDAKTIMRILASHDVSATECASYAAKSGDIATAVNTALAAGSANASAGAQDALRILNSAPFELAEPLYYRHASTLLARAPVLAGNSFLTRYANGLAPTRLLPSIMHYEKLRSDRKSKMEDARKIAEELTGMGGGGVTETKDGDFGDPYAAEGSKRGASTAGFVDKAEVSIKYLEGVIQQGCRNSAIFRFLISLYVKLEDEDPLYRFLSVHVPAATTFADAALRALMACDPPQAIGDEEFSTPLDMSHALRAVLGSGRHFRSAIKLYMGFGMRQQAVELALKVDPSLARELAQASTELEERKRLWLMIAKHAASSGGRGGKDVVSKVVSVLRDCGPDVLSIEDVLPFLPDFAQIDQIKDEICEALTAYSSKIEGFLKEMNECDQTCSSLREEIKRLRTHRMKVKSDARCALTNQPVLNAGEPFYVFPSGYVFLRSALKKEVMPFLNERQKARVAELEQQLQTINNMATTNTDDESRARTLQTELDGLVAAECCLTGSVLVNSIDKGFEDSEEIDAHTFAELHRLGTTSSADRHTTV